MKSACLSILLKYLSEAHELSGFVAQGDFNTFLNEYRGLLKDKSCYLSFMPI